MSSRSTIIATSDGLQIRFQRARILVEDGPEAGMEFVLADHPVVVGRDEEADLRLTDPAVSRLHLQLQPTRDGWKVKDLGSGGGTYIKDVEVELAPLPPDTPLTIGDTELVLRTGEAELRAAPSEATSFHGLVGKSPPMRALFGLLDRIGDLDLPVLIMGESGTGKEGLAKAVHLCSSRAKKPYEVVDSTLLTGEHLRSELFGHVKGAFTGADADRDGAFVRADGGTLFLDEIAEIPLELQPTLLRVLEEGEVRALGGSTTRKVRVRVVAATNRNLPEMIAAGTFREDLFYRLSALQIDVPPLRDRTGDPARIAETFLPKGVQLTNEARMALDEYPWPGNVRELRNCIQRAAGLAEGGVIGVRDLMLRDVARPAGGLSMGAGAGGPQPGAPVAAAPMAAPKTAASGARLADYEEQAILEALEACGNNRRQAAKRLGIARSTLYRKLKELGID